MALRRIGRLTKFTTKTGLAGGACYVYYEAGLWKSSDETIQNYAKFKKDTQALYDSAPEDVKKWAEYCNSTVNSNVEPYTKSAAEFRKEWLDFDLSWMTPSADGIIKPTWNKGVSWTVEAIKDSPQTLQKWGSLGMQKIREFSEAPPSGPSSPSEGSNSGSLKQ